jgi:hypothetical protein
VKAAHLASLVDHGKSDVTGPLLGEVPSPADVGMPAVAVGGLPFAAAESSRTAMKPVAMVAAIRVTQLAEEPMRGFGE